TGRIPAPRRAGACSRADAFLAIPRRHGRPRGARVVGGSRELESEPPTHRVVPALGASPRDPEGTAQWQEPLGSLTRTERGRTHRDWQRSGSTGTQEPEYRRANRDRNRLVIPRFPADRSGGTQGIEPGRASDQPAAAAIARTRSSSSPASNV